MGHIAKVLEYPLLLPKDMDDYRSFKQNDLLLSLKRDLSMVNCSSTYEFAYQIIFLFLIYSIFVNFFGRLLNKFL